MTRITICDPRPTAEDRGRMAASLGERGYAVETFSDGARFLEAMVANPPDLVVYALGDVIAPDLAVLRLLRRAQPELKLVVIARLASLETRAEVQTLSPTFYSVGPFDADEVTAVVQAAMRRRARAH
jgi:DNA-binding response OmpR family regulator